MIVEILRNSVSLEFANELRLCECVYYLRVYLYLQLSSSRMRRCRRRRLATSESPLELSLIRVQIINFQLLSEAEAAATARETSRRRCNPSQAVTHFVDGFGIVLGLELAAAKSPQLREYLVQFYWN